MLSDEEIREIEAELPHYPRRQAVAPEALMVIQRHRGWVDDQAVRDVAELLAMTPEEVESVATFYSLIYRQPVGRHVIGLCDSISCWVMGYENVLDYLSGKLGIAPGETTPDGRFTLLPVCCLGACDLAPAMKVDADLHGHLTPEKVDEILERYP
jgi:NADH-quinone oxidoreductase subunit E